MKMAVTTVNTTLRVVAVLLRITGVCRMSVMTQFFAGWGAHINAVFIQHRPHGLRGNQCDQKIDDTGMAVHDRLSQR